MEAASFPQKLTTRTRLHGVMCAAMGTSNNAQLFYL
jgi:hypothetical protein